MLHVRAKPYTLDLSQRKALVQAFANRVALIQGPPGTGKTFIGSLLLQLLFEHTKERILCVCYTNHALDQFLEHLINAGINSIVRIGAQSKNASIEPFQLRNRAKNVPFTMSQTRQFAILKQKSETLEKAIKTAVRNRPKAKTWQDIETFLSEFYPEVFAEFASKSTNGMKKVLSHCQI